MDCKKASSGVANGPLIQGGCILGGCSKGAKDPMNIDMNFAVARVLSTYVAQDVVFDF